MSVEFTLFAPRVQDAAVVGSWNHDTPLPMQKGDDGYHRLETGLPDGVHEYRFAVVPPIAKPDSEPVLVGDPTNIRLTKEGRSQVVVRNGNAARLELNYAFTNDGVPLPDNDQMVIYEIHVGDFAGGNEESRRWHGKGTFHHLCDRLEYLTSLGVNAIELMPVNAYPRDDDWGYSQRSVYAVEESYGTPDDLAALIDTAHGAGLRMIMDGVYNHMAEDALLAQIDHDYWFYAVNPDEKNLQFGPKFNYKSCDEQLGVFPARQHVIEAIQMWVRDFRFDGIRFDLTRGLRFFDLMRWFRNEAERMKFGRPFVTIAEHIPADPAIIEPSGPLHASWNDLFRQQVAATLAGAENEGRQPFNLDGFLEAIDARRQGFPRLNGVINYLDNHDHDRIFWTIHEKGVYKDEAIFRRLALGATILLTAPGIPMIWMGTEFGMGMPKDADRAPQPLDWGLLNNEPNQRLFEHFKRLIALRKELPALTSETFDVVDVRHEQGILVFKRWNDEGSVVLVLLNLQDQGADNVEFQMPAITNGTWCSALDEQEFTVSENRLTVSLPPSGALVLIQQGS